MNAGSPIETIRIARIPAPDRRPSAHRLGWLLTAGAAAVSLVLGAALPARAVDTPSTQPATTPMMVYLADILKPGPDVLPEPVWQKKRKPQAKRIPAVCALEFESGRRSVTVYPERCLRREGVEARLPAGCAMEARIWGKRDRVYPERCLRDAGFRLEEQRWRGGRRY